MNTPPKPSEQARQATRLQTHFAIYEDLTLVRKLVFEKERITIGSSQQADLYLDHGSVESFHAEVHHRNRQVFLTNRFPQNGLQLNGRSVGMVELQQDDVIEIGPFSLRVEITESEPPADTVYAVRLINRYPSSDSRQAAAAHLADILSASQTQVLPFLEKEHHVIKQDLSALQAAQLQNQLLNAGVICDVRIQEDTDAPPPDADPVPEAAPLEPATDSPAVAAVSEEIAETAPTAAAGDPPDAPEKAAAEPAADSPPPVAEIIDVAFTEIYEDDIDEDDEEIWEAPFSLKSELQAAAEPTARETARKPQLQVIKTIGDTVADVHDLGDREKYIIDTDHGRIRLVDASLKGERFINLLPAFSGYLQASSGEVTADLDGYKKPEYLKNRKKRLYRIPLPEQQAVVIDTPGGSYRLAWVQPHPTPAVAAAPRPADFSWRHWASSAGIHLLLLACLSVAMLLHTSAPAPPAPHFVELDPAMLEKLQPVETPPPPQPPKAAKKPEPPKPEPVKADPPPKKVAKKSPTKKKTARAKPVSRHAKAGGGHGKGNIKNRNVKQAGLLSMLGGPSAGGTSTALVAVTNLDAVPVPGATEKDFSVGGLKGALGNGTIAVATQGAIMQTKGSQQVLRSAGAGGSGHVAALERGTTGNKKVQAMVTAKMNRKVTVKGGMSREVVKRVIDQHLEEITYCYETALMNDPSILGRIVFEWKILMNGRVGEIRIVASSVSSHDLHACIKTAIKSWQFPKPVGSEVIVSYPFVFDLVSF